MLAFRNSTQIVKIKLKITTPTKTTKIRIPQKTDLIS